MQLRQARVVVAGATGALGQELTRRLHREDARVGLMGRDQQRLADLAAELGGIPARTYDALDTDRSTTALDELVDALGGLDLLLVASGIAAFGAAEETDDETTEMLLAVNAQGPIALMRSALRHFDDGGSIAAISAVLADHPTARMAEYSASKAALSAWMTAVRHEKRRDGVTVFDIRPPHMDTGLVDRAIAGEPPAGLPEPWPVSDVVDEIIAGLGEESRELALDSDARRLRRR